MSQAGRKGDQRGGLGGDPPAASDRADADPGDREEAGDLEEHVATRTSRSGGAGIPRLGLFPGLLGRTGPGRERMNDSALNP